MKNIDSLKIASKLLKSRRESLQLSIKEVSIELRLEERIVRDIESANFTGFKSYLFLKGYLLNYASLLDVNISLPEVEPKNTKINANTKTKKIIRPEKYKKNYLYMIFPVILLILVVYKIQQDSQSIPEINNADNFESIPDISMQDIDTLRPSVDNQILDSSIVINIKEADTKNNVISDDFTDQQPEDLTQDQANKKHSATNSIVSLSNKDTIKLNNIIIIGDDPEIVAVGKKLEIFYNGDSWTEIIDSYGNIVYFDLAKQGKTLEFNILAPFEILIGDATVVDIKYNNKNVSVGYINPDNNVGKIKIKE